MRHGRIVVPLLALSVSQRNTVSWPMFSVNI